MIQYYVDEAHINFRPVAHLLAELHNIDVEKFCSADERPSFEIVKVIKSWLKFIDKFYCSEEERFRYFILYIPVISLYLR